MAKEFKNFDKKYKMGSDSDLSAKELEEARKITSWPFAIVYWSLKEIRHAVYEAEGFEEWQKFRVSMKGQSTQVKLYRLKQRAIEMGEKFKDNYEQERIEKCRIDNYIGALVRGGQLNIELVIQGNR